jgi:AcrR family transcriptional regulator
MSNEMLVTPWGGRVPSQSDIQDQKKVEMLKAAAFFFSRQGYNATSLKDVAKSIGITKSLLYYYFKDKQQLLFECSLLAHESIQFEPSKYDNAEQYISVLFEAMVSYVCIVNGNNFQFVMFMEPDVLSPEQLLIINGLRDRFETTVRDLLVDGQNIGALIEADVKIMGFAMIGAANWLSRWWRKDGERSLEDLAAGLVHLSMRSLLVKPTLLDNYVRQRRS